MNFRLILCAIGLAVWCLVGGGGGCGKSPAAHHSSVPTVLPPETVVSVHWMGKHWLDLNADAYYFSRVWSLPETARLQAQTFDRLSVAFWRQILGDAAGARIPPAVLLPLFQELTQAESYLEIRTNQNTGCSAVLATRLDKVYAGAWETNLAITAELLAGTVAIPDHLNRSWTVPLTNSPRNITFQRIGSWAVLAVGPPHDPLAEEISTRLAQHDAPFVSSGTNFWLEASLRPARLAAVFPSAFANLKSQVSDVESLQLSFSGDGANVIARAKLNFSRPFTNLLAAWQLPLPLMHEPLTSFTAMRGIRPLLTALKWWPEFSGEITASAPPDQLFLWSLAGSPYQLYLAAPMADSRKWVADFSDRLMTRANPWLAANGYVSFARAADGNGVTWGSLPEIRPFIKSAGANSPNWLYAGLVPDSVTNPVPPPPGMIQDILQRTNLIYYDWEVTGPRLQPVLSVAQTARLVARCPQLSADSVSLAWLAALDPRLGTSATVVNRTGPAELTLLRRSTIGFTAPELQWLADWLESPRFPHGLHSAP